MAAWLHGQRGGGGHELSGAAVQAFKDLTSHRVCQTSFWCCHPHLLQLIKAELSTDPHSLPVTDTAVTLVASPTPLHDESLPRSPPLPSNVIESTRPRSSVVGLVINEDTSGWERAWSPNTRSSSSLPLKG